MSRKLRLEDLLKSYLPADITFGVCDCSNTYKAYPLELEYLKKVSNEKRAAEFKTGRISARISLSKINAKFADYDLEKLEDGKVAWPDEICGAITHSDGIALCTTALKIDYSGLGLDFELVRKLDPKISSKISKPEELELLAELIPSHSLTILSLFSAKESIYKCIRASSTDKLDFSSAQLVNARPILPSVLRLTFIGHSLVSKLSCILCIENDFILSMCWLKLN